MTRLQLIAFFLRDGGSARGSNPSLRRFRSSGVCARMAVKVQEKTFPILPWHVKKLALGLHLNGFGHGPAILAVPSKNESLPPGAKGARTMASRWVFHRLRA